MIYIAVKMSILGDFCAKRPVHSCVMSSWRYFIVLHIVLSTEGKFMVIFLQVIIVIWLQNEAQKVMVGQMVHWAFDESGDNVWYHRSV